MIGPHAAAAVSPTARVGVRKAPRAAVRFAVVTATLWAAMASGGCLFYNAAYDYAIRPPDHVYVDAVRGVGEAWTDGTRLVVAARGRVIHVWRESHLFDPSTWEHPVLREESADPPEGLWFTIEAPLPEGPDLVPVPVPRAARVDGRPAPDALAGLLPVTVRDVRNLRPHDAFETIRVESHRRDITLFLVHHRFPTAAAGATVWTPPPPSLRRITGDAETDWAIDREWDLWWLVSKFPGNAAFLVSLCPEEGAEPFYYMLVLDQAPYIPPPWRVWLIPGAVLLDIVTFPLQFAAEVGIGFTVS